MAREIFNTEISKAPGGLSVEYALDELYRINFGTWALPYTVAEPKKPREAGQMEATATPAQAKPWGDFNPGPKGQVYRMPMAIRPADGGLGWFQLPNEPMVSVEGHVQVVKTTINRGAGKFGTVTEEEYVGDYGIRVQGIAYNELENAYPEEEMRFLNLYLNRKGYLEVKHYILNQIFNIQFMKIERLRADRNQQHTERWQPYTLECFSVEDFNLL